MGNSRPKYAVVSDRTSRCANSLQPSAICHLETGDCCIAGPPFTKQPEVLLQDLVKARRPYFGCYSDRIGVKFGRYLGSAAAKMLIRLQSNRKSLNPNLEASKPNEILGLDTGPLSEWRPSISVLNLLIVVKISFSDNINVLCRIAVKFCTEQGKSIANGILCFWNEFQTVSNIASLRHIMYHHSTDDKSEAVCHIGSEWPAVTSMNSSLCCYIACIIQQPYINKSYCYKYTQAHQPY